MVDFQTTTTGQDWDTVFEALATEPRRAVLRALDDGTELRPGELAARLVGAGTDSDAARGDATETEVALRHVHLPILEDAGLITRDDGRISTTSHPAFRHPTIRAALDTEATEWDALFGSLADEVRRLALSVLSENAETTDRADLAAAVAEAARGEAGAEPTADAVLRSLHHVHLPKLADVGLVTYDVDAETVAFEGDPRLAETWPTGDSDGRLRARDETETRPANS